MTTHVKVTNSGHYPVVVNVWETDDPRTEGSNVGRLDLAPGETTPEIHVYSWRRGITILEAAPKEDAITGAK